MRSMFPKTDKYACGELNIHFEEAKYACGVRNCASAAMVRIRQADSIEAQVTFFG